MVLSMTIAREQCIVHTIYAKNVMIAFFHKIWRGPFEEPCRIKDPEMKKFHFCFSHFSKEADGKKRLSLKFSGFSLVSMLEVREPRSRFITNKAEWLWEREWESLK